MVALECVYWQLMKVILMQLGFRFISSSFEFSMNCIADLQLATTRCVQLLAAFFNAMKI
jgi:hypothetical protein